MKLADLKENGIDWTSVLEFCRKNIRYISAGVIVVILIIVLAVTAGRNKGKAEEGQILGENQENSQTGAQTEFEVDAIPEVSTLIQNYYTAYAAGDVTALEGYATPISDLEKGYIALMSQYVSGYENVQCNTKTGLAEGEYAVSVVMNMRFEGVETTAPGLDFFYVRTNESGAYYIDNLYSQFNLQNLEVALDEQVGAFIAEFEAQTDVIELRDSVQQRYDAAVVADEDLRNMVETTIPQAIQAWVAQITGTTPETETEAPVEETVPETTPETVPEETPATSETVYTTSNVNIRTQPSESAEVAGSAVEGQSFTRTATTEDGWSEVDYNGTKAYIKSDYITTEAPAGTGEADFIPEGTAITLNSALNVRASMSETGELVGTAAPGETVTVVLSYQEGWTRVEWNNTTGYIRTDLLMNN